MVVIVKGKCPVRHRDTGFAEPFAGPGTWQGFSCGSLD